MNGPIAQLVALACHANSFLKGTAKNSKFFPDNSTCKFSDQVSFVELKKSWLGKPREKVVAETPDAWFGYLARKKATCVRVLRHPRNDPRISDRMSAGFVGGGGQWMLGACFPNSTDFWLARWEVWNQKAEDQRIWRITYGLVARSHGRPAPDPILSDAHAKLESALVRIHAFSSKNNCGGFTECFSRALQTLRGQTASHGYHKDLFLPGSLTPSGEALLDAAQSAYVFGGMGSWNDMGFDGDDAREYEEASEELFSAVNAAICVAANESCRQ